ncbi:MAG: RNA polymerase sigma factor [Bdellovibrionota bacterium]
MNNLSDEELMGAYQIGDEQAFSVLYQRHSGRVYGFLKSKFREEAAAKDVLQATFLKLHRTRAKYDAKFLFVPWLFTICRNEMLDAFKKNNQRQETLMAETPEPALTPEAETTEISLTSLPAAQREAIELRFEQDLSFEQIAEHLATSPSNARQIVSRAVRSLRSLYEE